MKHISAIALAIALSALNTACSVKATDDPFGQPGVQDTGNNWPAYSQEKLAGKVFQTDWKAVTAVARQSQTKPEETVIYLYSDAIAGACGSQISSKPYATVIIPSDYKVQEYVTDLEQGGSGQPLVFTQVGPNNNMLIATRTKVKIAALTETGFDAQIYAHAVDENGAVSEINGSVTVQDCSKVVDFSVWSSMLGDYSLQSFDGVDTSSHYARIKSDGQSYYDRQSGKYLSTMVFPLFYSVSEGSSASYNFGPMQGLGSTTMTEANGLQTLKYSYHGPLNFRGMDITLNLDMTVVKSSSGMEVSYTLEIPGHAQNTSHRFTMVK